MVVSGERYDGLKADVRYTFLSSTSAGPLTIHGMDCPNCPVYSHFTLLFLLGRVISGRLDCKLMQKSSPGLCSSGYI
jgi:hypothetical protein